MRSLLLLVAIVAVVAGCGARAPRPTAPAPPPAAAPARDLAAARDAAPPADPSGARLVVRDPRVIDLDIIRIRASGIGGGDGDHVATADLFRDANAAAKAGETERAIGLYRRLVDEFPESQFAPVALINIAAIHDGRRDHDATIATLRELVRGYPAARESIDGHLYIAALQADRGRHAEAEATLDEVLARAELTYADRVEALARKGYVQLELGRHDAADATLAAAAVEWRRAPRIDDPYYIAMAHYYRGEVVHRRFLAAPVRLPDEQLIADLETKRRLAVQAYDRWKESLGFRHAYWATASGYQMSQIFVELWEATVKAPYPTRVTLASRSAFVAELHDRVRDYLEKALDGHRMNVELARAYRVDTEWSRASEARAVEVMELLAREASGRYVTPDP